MCARGPCALRPRRCVVCVCMLGVGVSADAESVGAPGSYQAAPLTARATSMIEPERTHPMYCPLHRLWAQLSLVVIVFLSSGL